jgi:hypothetical protein
MRCCNNFGVAFQLLDVEQFGAQRLFFLGRLSVDVFGLAPGNQADKSFGDNSNVRQDLSFCQEGFSGRLTSWTSIAIPT